VRAGDGRLEVPHQPIPEDKPGVFKADYYNQPWIGDWDGDGIPDILTGGYVTGRIWFYRGVGRNEKGVPKLEFVGPLETDGQPIDTVWAAAPYAHDFDGDGKLDLVSGSWFWSGIHRKPEPGEADHLYYFKNVGTPTEPKLTRVPLPKSGEPPRGTIARPTVLDWNNNGLPDLLVSDTSGEYVFLHIGTRNAPQWQMARQELTIPWGFTRGQDLTQSWGDITGEGEVVSLSSGRSFSRRKGSPHSPTVESIGEAKVNGKLIHHPGPGYGDAYYHTVLFDWDGDGRADVLWGTQQGNIFFHRNLPDEKFEFAEGVPIKLINGQLLKVGPPVVSPEEATDFTILQGSRIVFVPVDFDGDGITDLVVADTYGNIQVFLNTRVGGTESLAPGVIVRKMPSRVQAIAIIDSNNDGKPDLLTGGSASQPGMVFTNESERGKPAISEPTHPLDLPYVFWGPRFRNVDWNGDGDEDLLIHSEFFSFWAERSFLEHGYRPAEIAGDTAAAVQRRR